MTNLQFCVHIRPKPDFDEQSFMKLIHEAIDSEECGLRTLSVQRKCKPKDDLDPTVEIYECKVAIHPLNIQGILSYQLIFGALFGSEEIKNDSTFDLLGAPADEMSYF